MKIIQPSRRFKQSKTDSRNEATSSSGRSLSPEKKVLYNEIDTESFSKNAGGSSRPESKYKSKTKAKRRSRYSDDGNKRSIQSKASSLDTMATEFGCEEEFDFDTSRLEAMPKEVLAAPISKGKKRRRSELLPTTTSDTLELVRDPQKKEFNELFARGVRLLAMREHSVKEITNKLFDKSDNADAIHAVVDELLEKKYLSDERFTEAYIRARGNRGFGPVKIKSELKSKGVSSSLIQDYLNESASIWFDNAQSQYLKKYGDASISAYNAWAKRARFLQNRGFTMEHIHCVIQRPES